MQLTLVRNATLLLEIGGRRLMVDPMLDDAESRPPVEDTANSRRNPLVPLPTPANELVRGIEAVLVTHLHQDHFDATAAKLLPRDIPVFCQPGDDRRLASFGLNSRPVQDAVEWNGIRITRTGGRHGTGDVAAALGRVSGYVIDDTYIAGDTIWCDEVKDAIERHEPRVAVVNGSGARFVEGDPIVMTIADVRKVMELVPKVVVVHLEAINHCVETRADVRGAIPGALVPNDGETLEI